MEKKDLTKLLDEIFIPIGFKRKGNNWVLNGKEINKIINLQKSQYSNAYYINYGYVITSLSLGSFINHIDNRLSSSDKEIQKRIGELLNLENNIEPKIRIIELRELINKKIVKEMQSVDTEEDISRLLKVREHLYTIPPFVLKHFNITFEWKKND